MRFTVQYIPLRKIKPGEAAALTSRLRRLRVLMWDCMQLLVVRRNRRDGTYSLLLGRTRYDYLLTHTRKHAVPCLVDESPTRSRLRAWGTRLRKMIVHAPSLSIIRTFMREEPRFRQLTRRQQFQVLLLAIRYRETVVSAMIAKVDHMNKEAVP
jgi:hypothetical protein